ncbi:MAG TPA: carboxymuconolactone decarboxylase family protein [Acidimicrobiales bacterium]|nr:carboxymuconolactone decarboxylase family protein [Acidimicrobiales bacterium]
MSIEAVKEMLPDYARDLKLNLSGLANASPLSEQQLWGAVAAVAMASAPSPATAPLEQAAAEHLSPEARTAARSAAAIMAMNNVYYRAKHLLSDMGVKSYDSVTPRLRMQVIGSHGGVAKEDFELWCMAVSAVNGCGSCLVSHEQEVRKANMSTEQIHEGLRIAAVVKAVCATVAAEAALAGADASV